MKVRPKNLIVVILYFLIYLNCFIQLRSKLYYNNKWNRISAYVMYAIVVSCFLYCIMNLHFIRVSKWNITIYGLIIYELTVCLAISRRINFQEIVIDMLSWPLISIVFYDYCNKNQLKTVFKKITLMWMPILYIFSLPNIIEHLFSYGRYGDVIGPVYYLFATLPLAYLVCSNRITTIFSIITLIFITVSTKRLGFLIVISGMIMVFLVEGYFNEQLRKRAFSVLKRIIVIASMLAVGYIILTKYNIAVWNRIINLSSDEGSGRLDIWRIVMNEFEKSSIRQKVFGHGFNKVAYDLNIYGRALFAHNSFMEIMYDFGFVGLGIIISIVIQVIMRGIELIKEKNYMAKSLIYTIPVMLGLGFFGYFFEQGYIILPISAAWGICMSDGNTYIS